MSELASALFSIADASEFRFARFYIVCEAVPLGAPGSPLIVCGVTEKQEELNRIIAQYAIGWNLGRISRLARTFLRIALYECLYMEEIPNGVAINEAVKLTKSYDDEAAKFVNGILGAFVRGGCEIPPAPVQEAPECLEEEAPAADAPEAAQNPEAEAAAVAQGAAE